MCLQAMQYNNYKEFIIYSSSDDAQCVRRQTATSNGNHRGLLNAHCTAQRRVDIHDGVMLMFSGARVLYQPLQSYICVTNITLSRSDKEYQTKTYHVPCMQQILNPLIPSVPSSHSMQCTDPKFPLLVAKTNTK